MEKLRFAHQASVESRFVNGSLGFWKQADTDLLESLNHRTALLTFTHGMPYRPSVPP